MKPTSNYQQKLLDPRWQKVRLQIMERDNWQCRHCGEKTKTLNVHHKYYCYSHEPWEYNEDVLITLCTQCHWYEHEFKDLFEGIICDFLVMGHTYQSLYKFMSECSKFLMKYFDE